MVSAEKTAAVDQIVTALRGSSAALLTEYRGLTVAQLAELRRSLSGNATYAVVKNTLTKIAMRDAGMPDVSDRLSGPTAIAFVTGDPVVVAKGIRDFARANPSLVVKGGVLEGKTLSAEEFRRLADLESREVLLASLAGGMTANLAKAAGLFAAPLAQVARLAAALQGQRAETSPEPPAEEAADPGAQAQAVPEATDIPADTDVADGATSDS